MLDLKLLRKESATIEKKLQTKDPHISLSPILSLDEEVRNLKTATEELKSKRNALSQKVGELKKEGKDASSLMQEVQGIGEEISVKDKILKEKESTLFDLLARLPNIPMECAKVSPKPEDNVCIKTVGEKRDFSFPFKNHVELNEKLDIFDFKRATKMTGSGFAIYKGMGARLEWALINYMLDIHVKNGFMQWMPPLLVKKETMFFTGQLPKFDNQQFKLDDKDYPYFLIPTAEASLNALHAEEILEEKELPLKYVAYTPCFRREAGALGSQERGLIRMHQFNKVEMFVFSTPEESEKMFDVMMKSAEEVLEGLELHYRNMLLVTGDMSFAAAKTVDIEVYLPGQNRYYEVSSVSNCTDYQARRGNARYRNREGKLDFLHTLNGSGLATSRLMVALIENNQNEDGSISIPKVLQPYLGGISTIQAL